MRTIQRDIASALIESRDGKIFLARKNPKIGSVFPGQWTIAGGGIDEGETKEQAMVREIHEEMGLDVSGYEAKLVDIGHATTEKTLRDTGERVLCEMTYYDYHVIMHDKDAADISLQVDEEFDGHQWVAKHDLASIDLNPTCTRLLKNIGYLA